MQVSFDLNRAVASENFLLDLAECVAKELVREGYKAPDLEKRFKAICAEMWSRKVSTWRLPAYTLKACRYFEHEAVK